MLVPGGENPHRADHVLLSRALGCPPVHGRDLVVRGGGVFLRAAARPVRVLLPMVYGYVAASVAWAALGNPGLKQMAGWLKWVATSVLVVLMMVFVGCVCVCVKTFLFYSFNCDNGVVDVWS